MSLLDHCASGYEDGFSGEWYPAALQQHSKEDNQVSILSDQGEDLVYGRQGLMILLTHGGLYGTGAYASGFCLLWFSEPSFRHTGFSEI